MHTTSQMAVANKRQGTWTSHSHVHIVAYIPIDCSYTNQLHLEVVYNVLHRICFVFVYLNNMVTNNNK